MEESTQPPQDRRLQSIVYELDKKVHALEVSEAAHKLEVVYLKGEIAGMRSTTATSFELKAASDLINSSITNVSARVEANDKLLNERLDQVRKDFSRLTTVLLWCAATLVVTVISAIQWKLVVVP